MIADENGVAHVPTVPLPAPLEMPVDDGPAPETPLEELARLESESAELSESTPEIPEKSTKNEELSDVPAEPAEDEE